MNNLLNNELKNKIGSFIEGDITISMPIKTVAAEKLKIYYSAEAYAKTVQLVFANKEEVAWNMVIKPYQDGYKIYDILVCPQKVTACEVHIDTAKYGLWKGELPDEAEANLFGYGHSHVNFDVIPSATDKAQQMGDVIAKKHGFYFFQIWNKRLEINSFLYDIDNNLLYEKEDIEMIVEYENTTSDKFLAEARKMVSQEWTTTTAKDLKKVSAAPVCYVPATGPKSTKIVGFGKRKKKIKQAYHDEYPRNWDSWEDYPDYPSWYPNFEV